MTKPVDPERIKDYLLELGGVTPSAERSKNVH
jgi:hypothetical protein